MQIDITNPDLLSPATMYIYQTTPIMLPTHHFYVKPNHGTRMTIGLGMVDISLRLTLR